MPRVTITGRPTRIDIERKTQPVYGTGVAPVGVITIGVGLKIEMEVTGGGLNLNDVAAMHRLVTQTPRVFVTISTERPVATPEAEREEWRSLLDGLLPMLMAP